ncbi:MAG: Eco57I restriction-modification methylase domain-containing protein [Clostridiales bacterium]|nr:Eco57I restriction-modification methylase domain-containing protein [Clostridiales bacterium]
MNEEIRKIEAILKSEYSVQGFVDFAAEIFDSIEFVAPNKFNKEYSNFSSHIEGYSHIGNYCDPDGKKISVFSVQLKAASYVENSRSTQRSYARRLIDAGNCDAAIIAFYSNSEKKWRISFVRLDYEMKFESGKIKTTENLTPAKRYSFLVGEDEPCHTAISRFHQFIIDKNYNPTLDQIEDAFSIERVTKEFFELYCEKYHQLREALEQNNDFVEESKLHNYTSAQFAKKLMGQIVFLYFLQKKGWLGVSAWPRQLSAAEYKKAFFARGTKSRALIPAVYSQVDANTYRINGAALSKLSDDDETFLSTCVKGEPWGSGPHNFMRKLFELSIRRGQNFFDDYLEPLFYDALNVNRGEQGYDPALHCRIPFLSGGLFEPMDGYDWKHNRFAIPNELFSNADTKDRLADGILDIFDRYNFTMSEDEPLEREVAIDPEMLGKVFENLLDVNDRKSKGAFYTPREIVHYMCQESLIQYLTNTMQVKESSIRDFILYGDFMKDEDAGVLNRAAKGESYDLWISEELYLLSDEGAVLVDRMAELDKALKDVRVADPAVGSGAFPLGMLNEIVRARQNITAYMDITQKIIDPKGAAREIRYRRINDRSARQLKYDTIRNCIFAVDLEPSAVDIARLRLWLALVIDDEIDPNAMTALDGHRNPLPLPNLECNILCGNSLIDDFEGCKLINESDIIGTSYDVMQLNAYQNAFDAALQRLIEKQDDLFRCDNTDKKAQLLLDIDALRDEVIMVQLEGAAAETLEHYQETKNMASKPFVLWQLDFARVFREKGGFDIVIGNPPYVQLQKTIDEATGEKLGDAYENKGFETFAKTGDIYCLFYEKGYRLLRQKGVLSFITSNKWMRASYGEKLRGFFANKTNPICLIDFAGQKIFESATVDVNIIIFSKCENTYQTLACLVKEKCTNNLSVYVGQNGAINAFNDSGSWAILSSLEKNICVRMENKGIPLKQWNLRINRGILTGFNEAFIISTEKKDELIASDPKSADIIRPILRGRDIKRYNYTFAGLWLINVHNGVKSKGIPPINIDDYPAIKEHLEQYYSILSKRADKGDTPYNLRNCVYLNEFSKQKIVYREISDAMDACLVDPGYMLNNKCYLITGDHLIYVLSYLNSKLFEKIVLPRANVTGGKGEGFLREITLIPPTPEIEQEIIHLYDQRMNGSLCSDADVDRVFCKLYELSSEETSYIID